MSTRLRRIVGAAAVVFGVVSAAAAQSAPSHKGFVRDHTGTPLPGAVVTMQHPLKELAVRVALTDLRGEYEVDRLERGVRYVVRVSHPAYRHARIRAAAGEQVTVSLTPKRDRARERTPFAAAPR